GDTLNWHDRPYGVVVDDSGSVFVGGYTSPQNLLADTTRFFMIQYGADGVKNGDYLYASGNVSPLFLPGFVYKGIARDSSGYMYMIAAHRDGGLTDPVEWRLLKWGDVRRIVNESIDTIITRNEEISELISLILLDTVMVDYIDSLFVNSTSRYINLAEIDSLVPGFHDSLSTFASIAGMSPSSFEKAYSYLSGYYIKDSIQYQPTIFRYTSDRPAVFEDECHTQRVSFVYSYPKYNSNSLNLAIYRKGIKDTLSDISSMISAFNYHSWVVRGIVKMGDKQIEVDPTAKPNGCYDICYARSRICVDDCFSSNTYNNQGFNRCSEVCVGEYNVCTSNCEKVEGIIQTAISLVNIALYKLWLQR
ncbi:MAG: hypothetical protein KF690_10465, partial [Bacteroidetes bacterium]|nr:hypothetical protein [Bacteroidota bacterium]